MKIQDILTLAWEQMTSKQQWLIRALAIIVIVALLMFGFDSCYSNFKVGVAEREQGKFQREAQESLENANKLAKLLKQATDKLKILEEKQNETNTELGKRHQQTVDAQRDYDRVVRQPISKTPSTDELCRQLADLGYPCQSAVSSKQ